MGLAIIVPGVSFADANLGVVTINDPDALYGIRIVGPSEVVGEASAAAYSAEYSPVDTTHTGVVWSIVSGGAYASIDAATGILSVLEGASDSLVVIRAMSSYDSSVYAEKAVTVSYIVPIESLTHYLNFPDKTGYFITDILVNPTDTLKAVFMFTDLSANREVIGSRKKNNTDDDSVIIEADNYNNVKVMKLKSGGKAYFTTAAAQVDVKYVAEVTLSGASVSPSLGAITESDIPYDTPHPLAVGALYFSDSNSVTITNNRFLGHFWGAQVKDANGVLKHRLIPQPDGTLLDEVTNKTYSPTGNVAYV